MSGRDVERLCRSLRPRQLIPIHYEGWSHFAEGRAGLERAFGSRAVRDRLRFLELGERLVLEPST